MTEEQRAIKLCRSVAGQRYRCLWDAHYMYNKSGFFTLEYDQNCCAPEDRVLFQFGDDSLSTLMDAETFLRFYTFCAPA